MRWPIPLLFALLPGWCAAAENRTAALLSSLPACPRSCLGDAISSSVCDFSNATCICTEEKLLPGAALCISEGCSVREYLTSINGTNTYCGAPVRDKTQLFIDVTIVLGIISALFVLLRIGSKVFLTKSDFGLDDLFILLTLLVGFPSTAMNIHGTAGHGEGKDIWTLEFDDITTFSFYFYLLEVFYFAQVSLLKMSLLFFYLRIFLGPAQKLLWGTVVLNAVYGIVFVLLAAFQCTPVDFFWKGWDGEYKGRCLNTNAIGWANAAVSVTIDLWMLAIPLYELRKLKLHWKKKIGICLMFIVGTFVTVVSIIRLQYIVDLGSSHNPTYDQTDISIWSTVEINIGIICACLPALRILLVRVFPVFGGSTHDSRFQGYGDTSGRKSKIRNRSHALVELPSREESVTVPDHGIEMKRTFNIQYSDGDETSLVGPRGMS